MNQPESSVVVAELVNAISQGRLEAVISKPLNHL
jgi:hypothetical protein